MKSFFFSFFLITFSTYSQSYEELKKINEQFKIENKQLNNNIQDRIKELDTLSIENEQIKVEIDEMHTAMKSLLTDLENTFKTIETEKKIHNLSDLCKNYFLSLNTSDENFEVINYKTVSDLKNTNSAKPEIIEEFEIKSKVFLSANQPISKEGNLLFSVMSKNKNLI